ncbi:MAG: hypothetical protein V1913_00425 [Fibrobacterota bacterium]
MKQANDIQILMAEIEKSTRILRKTADFLIATETAELAQTGKTPAAAIMMAGILENYYTALETLFLRISQYFENHLPPEKWHMELLSRMTLAVTGLRERVISDETRMHLLELLRFRHFKRYYFEFEYDWPKIDFLIGRVKTVHPMVLKDVSLFREFLEKAAKSTD